jgi:hypothetical protein
MESTSLWIAPDGYLLPCERLDFLRSWVNIPRNETFDLAHQSSRPHLSTVQLLKITAARVSPVRKPRRLFRDQQRSEIMKLLFFAVKSLASLTASAHHPTARPPHQPSPVSRTSSRAFAAFALTRQHRRRFAVDCVSSEEAEL